MAYGEWSSNQSTTLLSNSYWKIWTYWRYRQNPETNKTQVQVYAIRITSLKSSNASVSGVSVTYNICTTGATDDDYNNRTTATKTIVGGLDGKTYLPVTDVYAEIPHSANGIRENEAYFHWWLKLSKTPSNFPSFTQGSHQMTDFKAEIPQIDRTELTASVDTSYIGYAKTDITFSLDASNTNMTLPETMTLTLPNGEAVDLDISTTANTYSIRWLAPNTSYSIPYTITKAHNGLTTTGSLDFTTNEIPEPSVNLSLRDVTDKTINIAATGTLYGNVDYDGETGSTEISVSTDNINFVRRIINPYLLHYGYELTQEEWGLLPDTEYYIEVTTTAPYTDETATATITATTLEEIPEGYVGEGVLRALKTEPKTVELEYVNNTNNGTITFNNCYVEFDGEIIQNLSIEPKTVKRNKPITFTIEALPESHIVIHYVFTDDELSTEEKEFEITLPDYSPYLNQTLGIAFTDNTDYVEAWFQSFNLGARITVNGYEYLQTVIFRLTDPITNEVLLEKEITPKIDDTLLYIKLDPEELHCIRETRTYLLTGIIHQPWKKVLERELNTVSRSIIFPTYIFDSYYMAFDEDGYAYPVYTRDKTTALITPVVWNSGEELPEEVEEDNVFFKIEGDE